MKLRIALIILIILVAGCVTPSMEEQTTDPVPTGNAPYATATFTTADGVNIVASHYPRDSERAPPVILLHMLGSDRYAWDSLAEELNAVGFEVLSLDMRGHGDSDLNARTFTEADWKKVIFDIQAAKNFLRSSSDMSELRLVGASIGANTALNYAAQDADVQRLVLLSPGLNYQGVTTLSAIENYHNALLVAASEDDPAAVEASRTLLDKAAGPKGFELYQDAGHGTIMFNTEPQLSKVIQEFLLIGLNRDELLLPVLVKR